MGAELSSKFANVSNDPVYVVSSNLFTNFSIRLVNFEFHFRWEVHQALIWDVHDVQIFHHAGVDRVEAAAVIEVDVDKELNRFIIYYVALQSINEVRISVLIQSHPSQVACVAWFPSSAVKSFKFSV